MHDNIKVGPSRTITSTHALFVPQSAKSSKKIVFLAQFALSVYESKVTTHSRVPHGIGFQWSRAWINARSVTSIFNSIVKHGAH